MFEFRGVARDDPAAGMGMPDMSISAEAHGRTPAAALPDKF